MSEEAKWSISVSHEYLISAIGRAMEDYLAYYARVIEEVGYEPNYSPLIAGRRLVLVVLLASYLEAIINTYYAFKFRTEQLNALRNFSLMEKWTIGPSLAAPEYKVDRHSQTFRDLKDLIRARNDIVHMRPEFRREGALIHKGNAVQTAHTSHESLLRWAHLPNVLVKHLGEHDTSEDFHAFERVSGIWKLTKDWELRLASHKDEAHKQRAERAKARRAEGIGPDTTQ